MKRLSLGMIFIIPSFLFAQNKGISFTPDRTWAQVQERAKKEKKHIFIDVYATWCVPCKMMDKNVYSSEVVAKYLDSNYVSLKLQMDRTPKDSQEIKNWYTFADSIKTKHNIPSYPTFLFLSADGDLMYRSSGYKPAGEFLKDAKTAIQSNFSLEQRLKDYHNNNLPYAEMEKLALEVQSTDNRKLAELIASKVKMDTLDALSVSQIVTSDHITFIREFPNLVKITDNYFKAFATRKSEIDSMVHRKGFSNDFEDYVIKRDFLTPLLWKDGHTIVDQPNWAVLNKELLDKFGAAAANRTLLDTQIKWYTEKSSWQEAIKYNIKKLDTYGLDTSSAISLMRINNLLYNLVFLHSTDANILTKSIQWMDQIIKIVPDQYFWIDTKANLLYKNGQTKEAIKEEQRAINIVKTARKEIKNYEKDLGDLMAVLTKMKNGKPTWK